MVPGFFGMKKKTDWGDFKMLHLDRID